MPGSLEGKTIVVTGAASGIGAQTALEIAAAGGRVLAIDRNRPKVPVDAFYPVDLSSQVEVDAVVADLPAGLHGLVNSAGLPPTRPPTQVVAVNLVALKRLTLGLITRMADGASIVNVASLAGMGWADAIPQIRAAEDLEFDGVDAFCEAQNIVGARSYFFSKEALIAWTLQNRWT